MTGTRIGLLLLACCPTVAFVSVSGPHCTAFSLVGRMRARPCTASTAVCMQAGKRGVLAKAFKKPTGALTVSLEYERSPDSKFSENDLIVLSMQVTRRRLALLAKHTVLL